MTDYNLGTARGRIKIDLDDKASAAATRNLTQFQKTLENMDRKMSSMSSNLTKIEKSLRDTGESFDYASGEIDGFSQSMGRADKSVIGSIGNFRAYVQEVRHAAQEMKKLYDVTDKYVAPLMRLHTYQKQTFNNQAGSIRNFSGAVKAMGVSGLVFDGIRNRILGMGKALEGLPSWEKKILKAAAAVGALTAATHFINKASNNFLSFNNAGKILEGTMGRLSGVISRVSQHHDRLGNAVQRTIWPIISATHALKDHLHNVQAFSSGAANMVRGASQMVVGFAVMKHGLEGIKKDFAWLGIFAKGPVLALVNAFGVIPAAVQLAGQALMWASNVISGLWAGIQQLSGGLLALPGALSMVGAAGLSVAAIMVGLKDKFKNLFDEDPIKAAEALAKLPPSLKALGMAMVDVKPKLTEFQEALRAQFFSGFDTQIRALADQFLPKLQSSMLNTTGAIRGLADGFLKFFGTSKTQTDFSLLFTKTGDTIRLLTPALAPLLAAFRDISLVGAGFLRDMAATVPGVVQKFADWARVNRENGNMLRWMQDAWKGAKDLTNGLWDVVKATYTILTIFKTRNNKNFLAEFADNMERFNDAVNKSAGYGMLRQIGDAVRNLGTSYLQQFKDMWLSVWGVLKEVGKLLYGNFTGGFVESIRAALWVVEKFLAVLNGLGIGQFLAFLLTMATSFKIIAFVVMPLVHIFQALWGTFTAIKGGLLLVQGLTLALQGMGIASGGVVAKVGAMSGALSAALGPITLVAAAILGLVLVWQQGSAEMDRFNAAVDDQKKSVGEFRRNLDNAFMADNGLKGHTVMDTVGTAVDDMMYKLDNVAKSGPGIGTHIKDFFKGFNPFGNKSDFDAKTTWNPWTEFGDTKATNAAQKAADTAGKVRDRFQELIEKGVNLKDVISSSDETFALFSQRLKDSGEGGVEAAARLQEYRDVYKELEADMARVGPGAIQVANGIKKIAESGDDATTKLEGLKQALTGLGFLKTDALEAAAAYSDKIDELGKNLDELSGKTGSFLDPATGSFNTNTEAGKALLRVMGSIGESFLATVAQGQSVADAYGQFETKIQGIMAATRLTREQVIKLGQDVGILPSVVDILIKAVGADQAKQDLIQAVAEMQAKGGQGLSVPVKLTTKEGATTMAALINSLLGPGSATATGTTIAISPSVNMADWNSKVLPAFASMGINAPGGPAPTNTATLPVAPTLDPRNPANNSPASRAEHQGKPFALGTPGSPVAPGAIATPAATTNPLIPDLEPVKAAYVGLTNAINASLELALKLVQNFSINAAKILTTAASSNFNAGYNFGSNFAAGITASTALVAQAALNLADTAAAFMPRNSPAKVGPLSGPGWTQIAGTHFSRDFATGIVGASGQVAQAAGQVAGVASGKLVYVPGGTGKGAGGTGPQEGEFLGQLGQLSKMFENVYNIFKSISDNLFQTFQITSSIIDANGGTFFGQKLGWKKTVSDAELQRKREDRLQSDLMSAARSSSGGNVSPSTTGGGKTLADITGKSSKQDIAEAILSEAARRGYSPSEARLILATAIGESGLNTNAQVMSDYGPRYGIFQQDQSYGTEEQRKNAAVNIGGFFDRLDKTQGDIVSRITNTPAQGGVQGGGYGLDYLNRFTKAADAYIAEAAKNPPATSTNPNIRDLPGLVAGARKPTMADLQAIASQFGLTATTYTDNTSSYHNQGLAWDISGKDKAQMEAFAGYMVKNFQPYLMELIFDSPSWKSNIKDAANVGAFGNVYTMAQAGYHGDHVHIATRYAPIIEGQNGQNVPLVDPNTTMHGTGGTQPGPGIDPSKYSAADLAELATTGKYSLQTQEQMLAQLQAGDPLLNQAIINGQAGVDVANSLSTIDDAMAQLAKDDTPAGRAQLQALQSVQSEIATGQGFTQAESPLGAVSGIASGVSGVIGDVFKIIGSVLDAVGGAATIANIGARGLENTEDLFKIVDEVQKFITLAADIGQAVTDGLSLAASIASAAGGADPTMGASGAATALAAAAQISAVITSVIQSVNAVIDLGQEAYRIAGTYIGDFLGFLVGGNQHFMGDVKFLLDTNTKQLISWSQDNPLNKVSHNLPGGSLNPQYSQGIGQINVYGGPGSDPRDNTREMMFAVKTASMNGVLAG
jgi:hypothetical protein